MAQSERDPPVMLDTAWCMEASKAALAPLAWYGKEGEGKSPEGKVHHRKRIVIGGRWPPSTNHEDLEAWPGLIPLSRHSNSSKRDAVNWEIQPEIH